LLDDEIALHIKKKKKKCAETFILYVGLCCHYVLRQRIFMMIFVLHEWMRFEKKYDLQDNGRISMALKPLGWIAMNSLTNEIPK
jgi:hypothetical protein